MNDAHKDNRPYPKRNPGTGFAVSGILSILAITAASAVYPDYSSRNQAISYLGGAGVSTELFWNSAVVLVGIILFVSSYLFFRRDHFPALSVFLALTSIGFLMVGTSPWNVYPVTHGIGANLIFIFGTASCLDASIRFSGSFSHISLAMGILSIIAYISPYFVGYSLFGSGGFERLLFYPILMWLIAFGGFMIKDT